MAHRIPKINELIKQKLAGLFAIDFPDQIIVINFIHTSSDLSLSKIFLSVSSGPKTIYKEISNNAGKYRHILAKELYIRKVPRLVFIKDEMQGTIDRIDKILTEE